jgi:DNA topoisomerase-3
MKRFADSVARQKGIKPPAGYTKSGSICRTFLDRHAPKKAGDESSGETGSKPPSQAQVSFAEKIAREKGLVIPDETKGSSAAVSAWIASNLGTERRKGRRKTANARKPPGSTPPKSTAPKRRSRKHTADAGSGPTTPVRQSSRPGRAGRHSDWGVRD